MVDLQRKRILLAGDLVIDHYVMGTVDRISPESPVPVLNFQREERRPGMAGNVALNLAALGQEVTLLSRIGPTPIDLPNIKTHLYEDDIPTPIKTRFIASSQHLLRVDYEKTTPLSPHIEAKILNDLPSLLKNIDLIAISDYKKGFLTPNILRALIDSNIPVIVDPKGRDYSIYSGAALIKPNQKEAFEAAPAETLDEAAKHLLTYCDALMVTRSEHGIALYNPTRSDYPAQVHSVRDVTGAGDTVLAILTAAMANKMPLADAAQLANRGASLAVQRFGCAHITLTELT